MAPSDGKTTDDSPPLERAARRRGEYVVVARRYRPQTFEELIGQDHVARALKGAIAANRVGHAYLFTGARGVGKTSAARILAKALNCQRGPTPTPCNQCDLCDSISAGSDVDVLEIDGASNRGIDEIRQLRQNVNIRPSRARFKVYIIDEVHMLTREAFNALLKTLEEPPEHVKFIFCTTEATKIPVTILSRCQRFDFAGIRTSSIVDRLAQIVAAEGVSAEPEALAILARRAGGSMRDSQSLLEQLLAIAGQKITVADVHALLGTAGEARLSELVAHLVERNAAGAIANLNEAVAESVDVGQLLEQLLGYFRDCMAAAVGCPPDALLHTSAAEHGQLAAAGKQLGLETILAIMQIIDHTLARLRYSTQSRTLAELALVRIASLENLDDLSDLIAQLRGGAPPVSTASSPGGAPTISSSDETAAARKKKANLTADVATAIIEGPAADSHFAAEPIGLTGDTVDAVWQQALGRLSGLLAENASLCDSVAVAGPGRLAATFRAKYTSCKAFCERPDQLSNLHRALAEAAGSPVMVELIVIADEPSEASAGRAIGQRQRMAEKAEHPMIRRAAELFDARLVRIEGPDT
ncbi:MAG: DNA polymerase III subunit gamma/tau [Pirellulales bacterium]